jgi:hypothetical protein
MYIWEYIDGLIRDLPVFLFAVMLFSGRRKAIMQVAARWQGSDAAAWRFCHGSVGPESIWEPGRVMEINGKTTGKPWENHGNREKLAEFRIWISFGIFWIYFYHDLIITDESWAMLLEDVGSQTLISVGHHQMTVRSLHFRLV